MRLLRLSIYISTWQYLELTQNQKSLLILPDSSCGVFRHLDFQPSLTSPFICPVSCGDGRYWALCTKGYAFKITPHRTYETTLSAHFVAMKTEAQRQKCHRASNESTQTSHQPSGYALLLTMNLNFIATQMIEHGFDSHDKVQTGNKQSVSLSIGSSNSPRR